MTPNGYKTSFTAGGLFQREALKIAQRFLELGDWTLVRSAALENNLLQTRTKSSSVRLVREVIQRMQCLTPNQLEILLSGSRQEQNQILWLAVCKHYRLVAEFTQEVIREKFLHMDLELSYLDYDIFFNAKAEWHTELDELTPRTKNDLRQVLFRMLREAEIISSSDQILPLILSTRVVQSILMDDPACLAFFPVSDADSRRQVKPYPPGGVL
jgi:hypothetical protein